MNRWSKEHWILLSLFLGGVASTVSGLATWSDFLKPAVLGGFILQLSTILRAFYSEKPDTKEVHEWKQEMKELTKEPPDGR